MSQTILLVEDDADMRGLLARQLKDGGYKVRTCDNGADVLPALYDELPDLMVLDVMLPGMDRLTLLSTIAREGGPKLKGLRVVVISAFVTSEQTFLNFPHVSSFLAKPFELSDFTNAVKKALGNADRPR